MTADKLERFRQQNMAYYGFGPVSMKKIRVCPQCGSPSARDKKYCVDCGHRLPDKTLYDLYLERHALCPVCKTVLANNMDFCPQCGIKTKNQYINRKGDCTNGIF